MSTIIRAVRDFPDATRQALEREFGSPLLDSQTLIINVVEGTAGNAPGEVEESSPLPDWCNVYAGLSDDEIQRLDQATKRRLDLTRESD